MYAEPELTYKFFNKEIQNTNFDFLRSLENQDKIKEAISRIDKAFKKKLTPAHQHKKEYFVKYKQELTNKIEKK